MSQNGDGTQDTVDDLRQKGNHEFQKGDLNNAVMFYTLALAKADHTHDKVVNLCNRSACFYQMERYEESVQDAQEAWDLSEHTYLKAAYRLAKTMVALQQPAKAVSATQEVVQQAIQKNPNMEPDVKKSLMDLVTKAQHQLQQSGTSQETSIIGVARPISIREFVKEKQVGFGNFSEIHIAQHKTTKETFALKILPKKQAADLAKRQHPNVYNEIQMEARVLMERVTPHPNIVAMYHAFQDYENVYYLMELHKVNPDLWSQLKYGNNKHVGCRPSQVKQWMSQLIDAIEHLHSHGIVHRDLKPENVLLNAKNEVVVIDLGTAKDLIRTDLNGPEFVGTPDFMSPEQVTGFSGMPKPDEPRKEEDDPTKFATPATDIWAIGAMLFILLTGCTPFWSPSPYLTFLRIKRGLIRRMPWGIWDDNAWDFILQCMQVDPRKRLGYGCFSVGDGSMTGVQNYDCLRDHSYFGGKEAISQRRRNNPNNVPSLRDLCVRACAELAQQDAINLELCETHPPGDESSHDFLRLDKADRNEILHILDRCKVFAKGDETRVLQRFVRNDVEHMEIKIRKESRDFVGLTQMNDDEYKQLSARGSGDPYAEKQEFAPTEIVHLTNPIFLCGEETLDEATKKMYIKGLKKCIASINRRRPKLVLVSGIVGFKCRKVLSRISDSIPVVLNDGSAFFSVWINAIQVLVLTTEENEEQSLYVREQMEQSRMAKQSVIAVCNGDPRNFSTLLLKRLARGNVVLTTGIASEDFARDILYQANETVGDDNVSVKSSASEEEDKDDECAMKVVGSLSNGLRWVTIDEHGAWNERWDLISET